MIVGEPGEVGAVGLLHYLGSGRRYVMEDTPLIGDPGKRYVSRVRGNGLSATVDTSFTALDGTATLLTMRWFGRATRPLMWVLLPFMRKAIARGIHRDLKRLKELVEQSQ